MPEKNIEIKKPFLKKEIIPLEEGLDKSLAKLLTEDLSINIDKAISEYNEQSQNFTKLVSEAGKNLDKLKEDEVLSENFLLLCKKIVSTGNHISSFTDNISNSAPDAELLIDKEKLLKIKEQTEQFKNAIEFVKIEKSYLDYYKGFSHSDLKNHLIDFLEQFSSLSPLPNEIESRLYKYINHINWNLSRTENEESKNFLNKKYKISEEAVINAVFELSENLEKIPNDQLVQELMIIFEILSVDDKNLPLEESFYKSLIDITKKCFEKTEDIVDKAFLYSSLTTFYTWQGLLQKALPYFPGSKIIKQEVTMVVDSGATGYDVVINEPTEQVVEPGFEMTIAEVNPWKQEYRFEGQKDWIPFSNYEGSEYYAEYEENYDSTVDLKDLGQESFNNAYEYKEKSEYYAMHAHIIKLNEKYKLNWDDVPKYSYLRVLGDNHPTSAKKYFSFDENGDFKFNKSSEALGAFPEIYKEILLQFNVLELKEKSQFALEKSKNKELLKKDPLIKLDALYLQAQYAEKTGDYYLFNSTLLKYINEANSNDAVKTIPEIKEIVNEYKLCLRKIAFNSLDNIKFVASYLFAEHEKILEIVLLLIDFEKNRLNAENDYIIDKNLFSPSYLESKLAISEGMQSYSSKKETVIEAAKPVHPAVSATGKTEMSEYLKKLPNEALFSQWESVLSVECPQSVSDFDKFIDPQKRQKIFGSLGDNLRQYSKVKLELVHPELVQKGKQKFKFVSYKAADPELSAIYYKKALEDEIIEKKYDLIEFEEKLIAGIDKAKFFNKAKKDIEYQMETHSMAGPFKKEVYEKLSSDQQNLLIETMATSLVEKHISAKMEKTILGDFYEGGELTGSSEEWFAKWNDVTGEYGFWNWNEKFAREFFEETLYILASVPGGVIAEAAVAAAWFARGIKAIKMAKNLSLTYRTSLFSANLVGFTAAEKFLKYSIKGENPWKSLHKDLLTNALMFASVGAGKGVFSKTIGKLFKTVKNPQKILFPVNPGVLLGPTEEIAWKGASRLSQSFLKSINALGEFSFETGIFTGLGIAETLALGGAELSDVNVLKQWQMNIFTLLALKGGGLITSPLMEPVHKSVKKMGMAAVKQAEHVDPKYFLKNTKLSKDFFDAVIKSPVSKKDSPVLAKAYDSKKIPAAIDTYRSFVDKLNLPENYFAGKSGKEVVRIMKKVSKTLALDSPNSTIQAPSKDMLKDLAINDPEVFVLVTRSLLELNFTLKDFEDIGKKITDPSVVNIILIKSKDLQPKILERIKELGGKVNLNNLAKKLANLFPSESQLTTKEILKYLKSLKKESVAVLALFTSSGCDLDKPISLTLVDGINIFGLGAVSWGFIAPFVYIISRGVSGSKHLISKLGYTKAGEKPKASLMSRWLAGLINIPSKLPLRKTIQHAEGLVKDGGEIKNKIDQISSTLPDGNLKNSIIESLTNYEKTLENFKSNFAFTQIKDVGSYFKKVSMDLDNIINLLPKTGLASITTLDLPVGNLVSYIKDPKIKSKLKWFTDPKNAIHVLDILVPLLTGLVTVSLRDEEKKKADENKEDDKKPDEESKDKTKKLKPEDQKKFDAIKL